MLFTGMCLLFFVQQVSACVFLPHRMPSAKFTNISREAFKKLSSETWQGSSALRDSEGKLVFEPIKNSENPRVPRLNTTNLKKLLGDDYDPRFMSETKPNRAWLRVKSQLNLQSEFEVFKREKGDVDSFAKRLDKKLIQLNEVESIADMHFWLWNLTRCTVEPLWKDFGVRVWPRYVNCGKCSTKPTCSLPSGMKCRPSKEKKIRLLYSFCSKDVKKCFWSSFQVTVIRACSCSC